jgi:beta-lactamase class A
MRPRGWGFTLLLPAALATTVMLVVGFAGVASGSTATPAVVPPAPDADYIETAPPPEPSPVATTPSPVPRSFAALDQTVRSLAFRSSATVAISLVELEGADVASWSLAADAKFAAASTYKLPLLMAEAQGIAAGTMRPDDRLCYRSSDYEDGWYDDYSTGSCFTRQQLAQRVGRYSDNTAAHMLVRYLGGPAMLNAYARSHGATASTFWLPNTTTAADLARLWQDEADGDAGGDAARKWLYPLLTDTVFENGVPAGLPDAAVVVHKVGEIDAVVSDAALVENGPHGGYVLVVVTDGLGGDAAWDLIANISTRVWTLEQSR